MRSSCGRVRASGRRCRGVAAALTVAVIAIGCGDNLSAPRLVPARFVYDDGTEQIDHRSVFDRELETTCEPTLFSDGATYCKPPAGDAFFADDRCIHPLGRVPAGQTPEPYFATTFTLEGKRSASRVFRLGAATGAPFARYERAENQCVARSLDDGFDYYELGAEVTDLPRVHLATGEVFESWQINDLVGDGLELPWRLLDNDYGECDVLARPNHRVTHCEPSSAAQISYYSDSQCMMPMITAPDRPEIAYSGSEGCRSYFEAGLDLLAATVYQRIGEACVESSLSGPSRQFTVGRSVVLPTLKREPTGDGRLLQMVLSPTPLPDEVMFDTSLRQACERDAHLRCVPTGAAAVESWFADPLCGEPVEVAMVEGGCAAATKYARNGDTFYPVLDVYLPQLYQLEPGDRCGIYNPPMPFVAHSIGPALGEDTFARATLVTE